MAAMSSSKTSSLLMAHGLLILIVGLFIGFTTAAKIESDPLAEGDIPADNTDEIIGLGLTVFIVIVVVCALVIIGGITACVVCCVCRGGRRNKNPPVAVRVNGNGVANAQANAYGVYGGAAPPAAYVTKPEPQMNFHSGSGYRHDHLPRATAVHPPHPTAHVAQYPNESYNPPVNQVNQQQAQQQQQQQQQLQQQQQQQQHSPADPNLIVNRFKPVPPPKPNRSDPAWNAVNDEIKNWQNQHHFSYNNYGYSGENKVTTGPKPQENFMY